MNLTKDVELEYAGVPGKTEDKVNFIFDIKNSALSNETKDFIFNALKSLSSQNLNDCQEIGHSVEVEVSESDDRNAKVQKAMEEHGLTENQAFLYVNGDRSLTEAKKASNKVRKIKK